MAMFVLALAAAFFRWHPPRRRTTSARSTLSWRQWLYSCENMDSCDFYWVCETELLSSLPADVGLVQYRPPKQTAYALLTRPAVAVT